NGSGDAERYVAVDARSGVPAGSHPLVHDPNGQHVDLAGLQMRRQVERERAETVDVGPEHDAVQPDLALGIGTLEAEFRPLTGSQSRGNERLAIPADSADRVASEQ